MGFPDSSIGKESTCSARDPSLIPGLGSSAGEGKGYALQYSSLENFMDCIVHRIAKSWTQLNDLHFHHIMDKLITSFLGHQPTHLGLSTHIFWSKTFSEIFSSFFFSSQIGPHLVPTATDCASLSTEPSLEDEEVLGGEKSCHGI